MSGRLSSSGDARDRVDPGQSAGREMSFSDGYTCDAAFQILPIEARQKRGIIPIGFSFTRVDESSIYL